jgi:predicted ABC-class ATPase
MDGRGYRAYKDLAGAHELGALTLFVDHVQGDPFAAPSKLRLRAPMAEAALPPHLFSTRVRRLALADFLAREARRSLRSSPEGSGRSGTIHVDAGGQEVLERSAVIVADDFVELRLEAGLPARGRRILGRAAARLLTETLPNGATAALYWEHFDAETASACIEFVECVQNQEAIRAQLQARGLIAFVADGSVLPRESGASDRPLPSEEAVPFESPEGLRVCFEIPNAVGGASEIAGLGIPRGVTLVVGGGYHGKSTLLRALERGVYPHVPGDGREYVVSDPSLVKVRAEDGRSVEAVDIHAFIDSLPGGDGRTPRDTHTFSTDDASGSTSQAASLVEAVEAGATGLLLDEDTSATNFMVRDARMQALVHKEHEPITPFVDRVRELYEQWDVSTVLVMGGSGDYFDAADHVIAMRDYRPLEATSEARAIAARLPTERATELALPLGQITARVPDPESFDPSRGRRDVRIAAPERDRIVYGREPIDLRGVEQLVDPSQTQAVGLAIYQATRHSMSGSATLPQVLDALDSLLDSEGLDALDPFASPRRPGAHPGNLARPRRFEIAAAINRLRGVRMQPRNESRQTRE